jgi:DNA-binding SARP family transcriptional activator
VLRVTLFGKFSASTGEHPIKHLGSRKAQELLSYLLLYRNRSHPREVLASLLWGDCLTAQSKAYLRKALWQLQAALAPCLAGAASAFLRVDADWIQLDDHHEVSLDVSVFERAFERVRGVPGEQLDEACFAQLRETTSLYQGDLLEGWCQDWCLYERERLQTMYLAMLDKLMGYCEVHGAFEAGLAYGDQVLRYDRAREQTHRRIMRLLYLAGDRTAALRQYDRCRAALDEDLGVEPTDYTLLLYQQIRDNCPDNHFPPADSATSAPASGHLRSVLERLAQIQRTLDACQRQMQQEIQVVEQLLREHS